MSLYAIKIIFLSIQNTHHKNLIFQNRHSLFQNFGRPAQGGQSTDMHNRAQNWASGRPVHRPVDRLGDLELTWSSDSVRSTGSRPVTDRQCKPSRPAVDRSILELTHFGRSTGSRPASYRLHISRSTGSRPKADRQAKPGPEFCFLFCFKFRSYIDTCVIY